MKNYQTSVAFSGEPGRAVDFIAATLAGAGYTIESRTASSLRVVGQKGWACGGRSMPPLGGAAWIEVRAGNGLLSLEVELGHVDKIFAAAGGVFALFCVGTAFAVLQLNRAKVPWPVMLPLALPVVVMVVTLPMARVMARGRIHRGFDGLLQSAAVMARGGLKV